MLELKANLAAHIEEVKVGGVWGGVWFRAKSAVGGKCLGDELQG